MQLSRASLGQTGQHITLSLKPGASQVAYSPDQVRMLLFYHFAWLLGKGLRFLMSAVQASFTRGLILLLLLAERVCKHGRQCAGPCVCACPGPGGCSVGSGQLGRVPGHAGEYHGRQVHLQVHLMTSHILRMYRDCAGSKRQDWVHNSV